ncbi:MAG: phosphotransferase [bacterium]|nr:phosphotransferase [bacterium]
MPVLPPPDEQLPAFEVLLGPSAIDVLNAGLNRPGVEVQDFRTTSVRYLPGKSITAQYRVTLRDADGRESRPAMVASSGIAIPDRPTTVLRADGMDVAVWTFPNDPFLPGLPLVNDAEQSSELLTRLGAPTHKVRTRTRAYRAGRRAVVEVAGDSGSVFMKVLRPKRVAALQARHVELAPHIPIPQSLGWSSKTGIVAMQALGGETLRKSLEAAVIELPSPDAILALLDQFPPPGPAASKVRPPHERVAAHSRLLCAVLPTATDLIDTVVAGVSAETTSGPLVAVHGDFHASQILINNGRIVGLVDVDTSGAGERIDDLAAMIGQLATLGITAENPGALKAYNSVLLTEFARHVDDASLRRRVAAVILGLATGPFRVQLANWPDATRRRLQLALRWLESAESGKDPINP